MAAATLRANAYKASNTGKKSLLKKFWEAYQENLPEIICGYLAMNGTSNVYPLYRALKEK